MFDFIRNNWPELLQLLREHLVLVLVSTSIAVLIGIPTGILLTRKKTLRGPVLGIANVMQTIPSLALFGLLIPIKFIGGIGPRTAIIALVLYALLPIIRNTFTGILGVDSSVREAAAAMGMTDRQVLFQVELPLAMPVILTGIRVALVISVGVATIAAAVGAGGLGVYIFRGLRQYDNYLLLAGAVPAALMALVADFSLGLAEKSLSPGARKRSPMRRTITVVLLLSAVLITIGLWIRSSRQTATRSVQGRIVIGSKDFTESILLAEIVAQLLEQKGVNVVRQYELGGNVPHEALLAGRIDLYPEYTGTCYTAILHHPPLTDPRAVYDTVKREYAEKFNVQVGPPLGFENTFAILVRAADAKKYRLETVTQVVPLASQWRAGFGQDFMSRADGYPGFSRAYGLVFAEQPREMDLSLTYIALSSGQVDLIAGNSTEGRIAALDLYQLTDDKHYFPPYEAIYLVREQAFTASPELRTAISRMANAISTEEMRRLNYEVDANKQRPADVVRQWLLRKNV
jgi:osmoprotectant transport system permease protein